MSSIITLGIAGGTGSGKTTLTRRIAEEFTDNVTIIRHDDYYRALDHLSLEERRKVNYDHPDSIETDLLIKHLNALKRGESVDCPTYDFTIHNRIKATHKIDPNKVIILEGILIFENKQLCDLMDIKIFVDTDADVRILRRIQRDVNERGRSLDSVIEQYLTTVKPMHEQYVEPSKKNADIIVPEGGKNLVALDMIINRIRNHISENK